MPFPGRKSLSCLATAFAAFASTASAQAFHPAKDLPPPPAEAPARAVDAVLQTAVASPARPSADVARDGYRHPYESLAFWGLKPGTTVIDLQPGGGYWTQILAPYLKQTGGTYIAGVADLSDPTLSAGNRKSRATFQGKFADTARYGQVNWIGFGKVSPPLAASNSVDLILTSREIHNWIGGGYFEKALADCYAALKPGGILAVEEHRADPKPQAPGASTGYVSTSTVIDAARRAGFELVATSEINANPRDDKDHPFGVWTLPPTRQSAPDGQPANPAFDHAKYDAVGESDRMTLRFRKPG